LTFHTPSKSLAAKLAELIVPISQAVITVTIPVRFMTSSSQKQRHLGNYFIDGRVPPDALWVKSDASGFLTKAETSRAKG
jgi:hypothetical protein